MRSFFRHFQAPAPLAAVALLVLLLAPLAARAGDGFGPLSVQFVTSGEDVTLDLSRFCALPAGGSLEIPQSPDYSATFDPATMHLKFRVSADRVGLVEIPLRIVSSNAAANEAVLTAAASKRSKHRFSFRPAAPVTRVVAAGSFNGWSQDKTPLTDPDGDGTYEAEIWIDPGSYTYKFVVDGKWIPDPANPEKIEDGFGGHNSGLRIEGTVGGNPPSIFAAEENAAEAHIAVRPGSDAIASASVVLQRPDGSSVVLPHRLDAGSVRIAVDGIAPGSWIRVLVADAAGRVSNTVRFQVTRPADSFNWQDAVMYFAFTDRFLNGDITNDSPDLSPDVLPPANFHGGDIAGIRQKIRDGYFESLGVNTIWISPVNRNPARAYREYLAPYRHYTGYHGYWPVSPTEVDPRFGTADELKAMVREAHARGMKVLADVVLNHTHEDHPFYREHPEWFTPIMLPDGSKNLRQWDAHSYTTWFDEFLPDINFDNPDATRAMLENTEWWAREFDFDGFRLDAVKHIQPSFWRKLREHLSATIEKERGRPLYLVGETFLDRHGIMSFVGPRALDGQFDFPLYDVARSVFAQRASSFAELEASLSASERIYGKESLMSPLVGNHDKSRFMAYADGDLPNPTEPDEEEVGWNHPPMVENPASYSRLRLAFAFLMSIDGVPMIYYGDEFGLSGAADPDNRRDMRFGGDLTRFEAAVLKFVSAMTAIRREHPALRYGSRRPLLVEADRYAFVRAHFDDRVVVAFNRADAPATVTLDVAPELTDGDYVNLIDGSPCRVSGGSLSLPLGAQSVAVIVAKGREGSIAPPLPPASIAPVPGSASTAAAIPAAASSPYRSVGMAGTHNNWNLSDPSSRLKQVPGSSTWELVRFFYRGTHKFKFVMNESWDVHRGLGPDGKLAEPGADIPLEIPSTGFYRVAIDPAAASWSLAPAPALQSVADVAVEDHYLIGKPLTLDASGSAPRAGATIRTWQWTQSPSDEIRLAGLPATTTTPKIELRPTREGEYHLRLAVDDGAAPGVEAVPPPTGTSASGGAAPGVEAVPPPTGTSASGGAAGIEKEFTLIVKRSFQIISGKRGILEMEALSDGVYRLLMPVMAGDPDNISITENFSAASGWGAAEPVSIHTNRTARIALSKNEAPITIVPDRTRMIEIRVEPATNELLVRQSSAVRFFATPSALAPLLPAGTEIMSVAAAGSFNDWNSEKNMLRRNEAGDYEIFLEIPEGLHTYKFVVNGKHWIPDPGARADLAIDDGYGGKNSRVMVGEHGDDYGLPPCCGVRTAALRHDPNELEYFNAFSRSTVDLRVRTLANDATAVRVIVKNPQTGEENSWPMRKLHSKFGFDWFGVYLPVPTGADRSRYVFEIQDEDTRVYLGADPDQPAGLAMTDVDWFDQEVRILFPTPDWAKNVVWYQIMLDRWRNNDPANDPDSATPWTWDWYQPHSAGERRGFYGGDGIWHRLYGGDLRGMIATLDYLENLGVTGIYLNPSFEAPGHHKYNTSDYRHIDDNFGTRDDVQTVWNRETADSSTWYFTPTDRLFLDFVREAHRRGFKVILDGVFNHSGTEFWAFQDLVRNGKNSPYKDWYVVKEWDITPPSPGAPNFSYEGWAGYAGLPEYAENENGLLPGIRNHIFDITRRWLDPNGDGDPSDGVDGWRLDVPENVHERFWREWRHVVKGTNPDAYITGEIWENAAHRLRGDHYDAVMNYEFLKRVYGFFIPGGTTKAMSASEFARSFEDLHSWYLPQVTLVQQNLLGSHDVDRIASAIHNRAGWKRGRIQDDNPRYDGGPPAADDYELLKLIEVFQMTWEGAPMIYYGDEVGMFGADDPSNRMPMWWRDLMPYDNPDYVIRPDLHDHTRRLIAIRNAYSALRTGSSRFIHTDDTKAIVAFERADAHNRLIVVLNNTQAENSAVIPAEPGARFVNLLDPASVMMESATVDGIGSPRRVARITADASELTADATGVAITLPPRGAAILLMKP
jgi:cyclomaltodextrinase / maltogenic alpha-amylase / neopullulanase